MKMPLPIRAAQILMIVPLGALVVVAALYFTAIAPPKHLTPLDGVVAACAFALAGANIYLGISLGRRDGIRRMAIAVIAGHVAFSLVKLVGYHESASLTFMALDAITIALLSSPAARRPLAQH
jgi:hypothetical protein